MLRDLLWWKTNEKEVELHLEQLRKGSSFLRLGDCVLLSIRCAKEAQVGIK